MTQPSPIYAPRPPFEDSLPYDEPWGWMQPVRHALGALLLEQGSVADAEIVYREDLGLGGTLPRAQSIRTIYGPCAGSSTACSGAASLRRQRCCDSVSISPPRAPIKPCRYLAFARATAA